MSRTSQAWTSALVATDGAIKSVEQMVFPFPVDHLNEVGLWDPGELIGGLTAAALEQRVRQFYLQLAASA